jgi:hypothetical protein
VAKLFGENCLREALIYLTPNDRSSEAIKAVRDCIQDAMLSPDNLVDYLNALEDVNLASQKNSGFAVLVQSLVTGTSEAKFDGNCNHLPT